MSESEYIEREMEQRPEPEYHSDLRMLRSSYRMAASVTGNLRTRFSRH